MRIEYVYIYFYTLSHIISIYKYSYYYVTSLEALSNKRGNKK